MKTRQRKRWAGLIVALLLAGCGGEDAKTPVAPKPPDGPPTRAEVVVEPSQQTMVIDGEERASVALVRELLADPSVAYPLSCAITNDEHYEPETRVRFFVEITTIEGEIGPDTAKDLAAQAYDALAQAFLKEAETALRAELVFAKAGFDQVSQARQAGQEAVRNYLASRSGLPDTKESRLETRRLEAQLQQALEKQAALKQQIESIERQIARERWATLRRIR